jgi:hypothetical protein
MWCSFANNLYFNSGHIHIFWAILSWAPSVCAMWISYWLRLVRMSWLTTDGAATKPRAYYGAHMVWVARHALVSWLIVVIHYETILMCYLLWTFSQSGSGILSQYVTVFGPNLSFVSCQIPSHEFASIFSLGVTCFSTLKDPHSNLGTRFF